MSWQDKALADCAVFQSGGTPNKGRPEYWGGAIPWVSSGEMTTQFIEDTSLHITEAGAAAGSRIVPAGTVFAVVRGMSLAKEFRLSYATREMAFNQDLKALTAKEGIDSYFLFSALRAHAPDICELATEAAHGTKKLEMERLQSFRIRIPSFEQQLRIADEVRSFDDLIANNQRRIALLEESARILYKEWFVGFRFPGHVLTNSLDVPARWTTVPLREVAAVNRASLGTKDMPEQIQYVDIASVSNGVLTEFKKMHYLDAPGRARRLVQHGDVIWSCVRPNLRSFALLWEPDEDVIVSTGFAVLSAKLVPFSYLYLATTTDEFISYLTNVATGAAYPAVSGKDFEAAPLLLPSLDVLQDFDARCLPLLELRNKLTLQNSHLVEARNSLLPRLLSGEVIV